MSDDHVKPHTPSPESQRPASGDVGDPSNSHGSSDSNASAHSGGSRDSGDEVRWISREQEILTNLENPEARKSRAPLVIAAFIVLSAISAWDYYQRSNRPPAFTQAEEAEAIQAMMFIARSAMEAERQGAPDTPDAAELLTVMGDAVTVERSGEDYLVTGRTSDGSEVARIEPGSDPSELETSFLLQPVVNH